MKFLHQQRKKENIREPILIPLSGLTEKGKEAAAGEGA